MRNLQKILALALALIMSFSLVVTANAAFSDEADINETYSEAVNVLSGLEVFRGYTDGSYQPQASITRAEVAAIIYRIATGDVEDRQVSLYSDYNRFTDVASGSWYAGYVNYCANAEYIQGYGDGRFGPNDPVTGYQALAMILRAVGYGKMNEFTGSNWAVQTAARANTLKISKNVTAALLGSPASREVVAELLFRSILVPTVDYNQFSGYTETDTNLAANLGLEAVKGVVVANQEADLYSEEVMAEGKTNLEVAENDIRTLDYTTTLDDIGESRYAYIVDSKVLALGDTGENVKFETGDKTDVSTDKKFKDKSGLSRSEDTEFYLNFGREGHFSCDQRLEFTVVFYNATAEESFDKAYEDISKYAYARNTNDESDDDWTVELGTDTDKDGKYDKWTEIDPDRVSSYEIATGSYPIRYNRVIRAEEEITAEELEIIRGIFAAADNDLNNGKDKDQITGDVFVGTKSTNSDTDEERDVSNSISFRKFKDEYINSEAWDRNFEGNDRGEWLKIVDCDNDGTADYAFLTEYHLDEVTGTYTKSGETKYEYEVLDVEDWDVVDYVDEVEVGTVVLTTEIDNKVTIKKAEILTDKIQTVSFRDETVTTVGGETKKQSEIFNDTRMDETITNMDDGVEYNMYLDRFGHIRAYELAAGTKYALLTELYYDRFNNSQYVKNSDLIAEVTAGEAKTEEFNVLNSKGNDFVMSLDDKTVETWQNLYKHFSDKGAVYDDWRNAYVTSDRSNDQELRERIVLQPAINNMALETRRKNADDIFENASTNIARYVQTDEGVRIVTAAEYAHDKKTNERLYYGRTGTSEPYGVDYTKRYTEKEWEDEFGTVDTIPAEYAVYKYNYIELDCWDGITADQRHYDIAGKRTAPGVVHEADGQWRDRTTSYINAVHDTEYYIVNRNSGKIDYFTDYDNVKKIDAELIEAVYAVAENTEADNNARDYWVADVIVIEVNGWNGDVDNISLVFDNFQQTSQRVKFLDTLTTKYEGVNAHVIPGDEDWGTRWQDIKYGFYMLLDAEKDGDELVADDIKEIKNDFAKYGIKAGVVTRVDEVSSRGGYIDVDLHDAKNGFGRETIAVDNGRAYLPDDRNAVYAIDGDEAKDGLHVSNNDNGDLRVGDEIIWVEKADDSKTVYFIVVVSDKADSHKHDWSTPAWLEDLYEDIIIEQRTGTVAPGLDVSFYGVKDTDGDRTITVSYNTAKVFAETYGDGADKALNIKPTQISKEISVKTAGDTYTAVIDGKIYTLIQSPQNTKVGTLYSTDSAYAVVTYDAQGVPTLRYKDATATLKTLEDILETTTGDKVSVAGFDGKGNPKSYADAVSEMTSIVVTITNSDGEKSTVTFTDTTLVDATSGISGFYELTLSNGVKAYKDNTKAEEYKSGAYLTDGTTPYFTIEGADVHGYFKINDTKYEALDDVDRDADGDLYFRGGWTHNTGDVTVSFVKKAPTNGKVVVAVDGTNTYNTIILKNDGSVTIPDRMKGSKADYIVVTDDWMRIGNTTTGTDDDSFDDRLNAHITDYIDVSGSTQSANVDRNYWRWVDNWDNGVFTYKAAGEFGGKDDVVSFEFFTKQSSDGKVPVIKGVKLTNGAVLPVTQANPSQMEFAVTLPKDATTLTLDQLVLEEDVAGEAVCFTTSASSTDNLGTATIAKGGDVFIIIKSADGIGVVNAKLTITMAS